MRCVQNKWGTGSCSTERQSGGSTEQEKTLQAMLAERAKQDAKWSKDTAKATAEVQPSKYTSAEPKGQSQAPSSSGKGQYVASSR